MAPAFVRPTMLSLRHALAAMLILGPLPPSATAQATDFEVASLQGIRRVRVIVETLHANLAAVADSNVIRTQIELKLREHGLVVASDSTDAVVYIQMTSVHDTVDNAWALGVQL